MAILKVTKIIKTGNSLCVVIPNNILTALRLKRGDQVAFGIYDENTLFIRRITDEEIHKFNPPIK